VAGSIDGYVSHAVRLGTNADARRQLREKITASRHVLFDDTAPVRALEAFLAEVAGSR
jgi:predicted O-linked N-acetylglucosamine transferase (SPINDLY family)